MELSYSLEGFTKAVQDNFKIGIAAAARAGCNCQVTKTEVIITRMNPSIVLPGSRRGLLAPAGIKVGLRILVPDVDAGRLLVQSNALSREGMNKEMAKLGVELITKVTSGPVLLSSPIGTGNVNQTSSPPVNETSRPAVTATSEQDRQTSTDNREII